MTPALAGFVPQLTIPPTIARVLHPRTIYEKESGPTGRGRVLFIDEIYSYTPGRVDFQNHIANHFSEPQCHLLRSRLKEQLAPASRYFADQQVRTHLTFAFDVDLASRRKGELLA